MSGLAPKLRFKQDDGSDFPEWEEKRLGDLYSWIGTNSLSRENLTNEINEIQNIHYGDIHTKFKTMFHQEKEAIPYIFPLAPMRQVSNEEFCQIGDVVIADASEDYKDIGKSIEIMSVRKNSLVAGLHTYIARPDKRAIAVGFSGYLFANHQARKQIMRIAQGISVLGISKTNMAGLKLTIPSLPEQQKIADFLSSVDAKIDAVKRKLDALERYKKGLMQQIFSQKIRFKQDDGSDFPEWEEKNIDYFFEVKSSKRVLQAEWKCSGIPFYRTRELVSLSNRQPLHNQIFISNNLYKDLASTYGVPSAGDFLVSGVGTLGIIYQVPPNNEFYFKDGNVLWFKKRNNCINSDFFKYAFQEDYIQNQIIAQTSTTTVGTYTIQNARVTKLLIPKSIVEQNKIAEIINAIDAKIDAIKAQVEKLEAFKKGLLQQMFV